MNYVNKFAVAAIVASPMLANAAAMTVPTEITDAGLSVLAIGLAVFGINVSIKLYKWVRRAL